MTSSTSVTPTKMITTLHSVKKEPEEVHEINHVSVKLPTFTSLRPSGYFLRIETHAVPEEALYNIPDYQLNKCLKSEEPYSDLKALLTRLCVGLKQQFVNNLMNLALEAENVSICQMEARAWDLINEITKNGTNFNETLVKHVVLKCIPTSSRQYLRESFSHPCE
ncbi:Uncharacterized protein FKW44_001432 [Caligus rogercresseyi]|uniref:Uncharacterized protein n=1 Tax=Caligus rogercresseyi TaxID=217165 RepID=A0A7T8KIU2_CALRO|nr:Uncharacterized protein FKW44_001432 [Caligus rogercresseyi]